MLMNEELPTKDSRNSCSPPNPGTRAQPGFISSSGAEGFQALDHFNQMSVEQSNMVIPWSWQPRDSPPNVN